MSLSASRSIALSTARPMSAGSHLGILDLPEHHPPAQGSRHPSDPSYAAVRDGCLSPTVAISLPLLRRC